MRYHCINTTIVKEIFDILERKKLQETDEKDNRTKIYNIKRKFIEKDSLINELRKMMLKYSENLQFEEAAMTRDKIKELTKKAK